MKQCSYCGKEYPDDAVVCYLDQRPLVPYTPEPATASFAAPKQKPPISSQRFFIAVAFAVLGGFSGVGITSVFMGILANSTTKNQGDAISFMVSGIPILITGFILGTIGGFILSLFLFKADGKKTFTPEQLERKYIGPGGLWGIYSGIPTLFLALTVPTYEPLARAVGEKAAPYVDLGLFAVILIISMVLYNLTPKKLVIPLGLIGWLLTFSLACWYSWFGPGAFGHNHL